MITAQDIMTERPQYLYIHQKLSEALAIFEKSQFTALPILDSERKVLGVLTEFELLRCLILEQGMKLEAKPLEDHRDLLQAVEFVSEADGLDKIVAAMLRISHRRVLVADSMGHLIGVISPKDLIFFLRSKDPKNSGLHKSSRKLQLENSFLRQLNDELKRQKQSLEEFKRMMEQSPFLMHVTDREGRIQFANLRMHKVLGYEQDELIGKTIADIYPEHLLSSIEQTESDLSGGKSTESIYSAFRQKNGGVVRVELYSSPIFDLHDNLVGISTLSRVVDSDVMLKLLHGVLKS